MNRRAFALMELLITIGIIGVATTLTIPLYREYQIRNDLDNATQLVTQGLGRAKLLSQTGQGDSAWGFYVPSGTLYKGTSYATRNTQFNESYSMPSTIAISGLLDVSYARVVGVPNTTGDIVLRALNNDQRVIQVKIAVDTQSISASQGDTLTICRTLPGGGKETIQIPDSTWPTYQSQGATMGSCPASSVAASSATSSVASSVASSAYSSSAQSSSVASSAAGGGGASSSASCKFTIASNKTINTTAATTVTFTNMLSQITFGAGGPPVNVHLCYSTNNGTSMSTLFGGSGNCKGSGNAYGNAVSPTGTDVKTVSVATGKQVVVRVHGTYKQNGWLAFDETYDSNDQTGHILLMRNGDMIQNYPGFGTQTSLKNYLVSKGKANSSGQVTIGSCEVLAVSELGDLNTTSSDFQDDVLLMSFN
jgi:Tfp pilus assembly major pilin PilA